MDGDTPRYKAVDMFKALDTKTDELINYQDMELGEVCTYQLPTRYVSKKEYLVDGA